MCDYCGCRSVEAIAALGAQHEELTWLGEKARRAIARSDDDGAHDALDRLIELLRQHTALEEAGVLAELGLVGSTQGRAGALRAEHVTALATADRAFEGAPGWQASALDLIADLERHISAEEYDAFPAALLALDAEGWERVARAHRDAEVTAGT